MNNHDTMIGRRFGVPLKKILQGLIDEINAEKDPDLPGEKSYGWRLNLFDEEDLNHLKNYITVRTLNTDEGYKSPIMAILICAT